MSLLSVKLFILLFVMSSWTCAFEAGNFMLQGQVGLSKPFALSFVTDYWTSSTDFSGGFGVTVRHGMVLATYTNQAFNRKLGFVAEDGNGYAHEILINFRRFIPTSNSRFEPFYHIAGGYKLLRTPILFIESKNVPGAIDNTEMLENSHVDEGFTVGAGLGLSYNLSDISMLFADFLFSTTLLTQNIYPTIGARTGVLFQLGQ